MSSSILKNSLVDLALLVAPELRAAPFYLLTQPPAGYPVLPHCEAFTNFHTDFAIRQALIDSGEWRGPGVSIVLNTAAIDVETVAALVIHEVAHNVPARPWPADREPSTTEHVHQAELVARWAITPESIFPLPPWHQHGLPFIRACLHLRERAARAGLPLPLPAIGFAGTFYGLSPSWDYAEALGAEPERILGATFSEIQTTAPPEEFTKLFLTDVADWHKHNPKGN